MPTTAEGVLSFLGLTGWYRRFIQGYSSIALPLISAIKSQVITKTSPKTGKEYKRVVYEPFTPTEEQIQAFERLKAAFDVGIVLMHFDPDKETFVFTDASGWASLL